VHFLIATTFATVKEYVQGKATAFAALFQVRSFAPAFNLG
jgi:hypothetical protein